MLTMEEALKQSNVRFAAGEIVKGTVIEVRPKEVLVDIGYKSEGVIPANEFPSLSYTWYNLTQRGVTQAQVSPVFFTASHWPVDAFGASYFELTLTPQSGHSR